MDPQPARLERSSSLKWGFNWDRSSVLSPPSTLNLSDPANPAEEDMPDTTTAYLSSIIVDTSDETTTTTTMPLPSLPLLKRAVTFSGEEMLSPKLQQRQRATSDAAAVVAAWGGGGNGTTNNLPHVNSHQMLSSSSATLPPSSSSQDDAVFSRFMPPRSHSAAEVWDNHAPTTTTSPRRSVRTRPMSTSMGSPPLLGRSWGSSNNLGSSQEEEVFQFDPNESSSPMVHASKQYAPNPPPLPTTATAGVAASSKLSASAGQFNPHHGFTPHSSPPLEDMFDLQMANLQAMQAQWMQMVQMQVEQTMYLTEQRMHGMHLSSPPTNPAAAMNGQRSSMHFPSTTTTTTSHPLTPQYSPIPPPMMYNRPRQPQQQQQQPIPPPIQQQHHQHHHHHNSQQPPPQPQHSHRHHHNNNVAAAASSSNASSSLLAEHKVTGRRPTCQELMGHVVEFSRDSHGSRLIQFKMETGTKEEKQLYVSEALPHTLSLARDLFGNYVVQNFFDNCDVLAQRDALATALLGSVNSLCTHPHGCRVVQRALFAVSPARRNDLIQELIDLSPKTFLPGQNTESLVRSHSRDAHATHVIQKAVSALQRGRGMKSSCKDPAVEVEFLDPPEEELRTSAFLEIVESQVLKDCIGMSMHQQACRLVQKVLGACENMSPRVQALLKEVFANIDMLAIHQNGNFVLQHLLECTGPNLAGQVQEFVCKNSVRLAKHKFGSHLVEKSLSCATLAQVNAILERFLAPMSPSSSQDGGFDQSCHQDDLSLGLTPSVLLVLMKDPYANFVVQKAFDVSTGPMRVKLGQEIRARTQTLSKFSYGRHILTHINRLTPTQPQQQQQQQPRQ